jgi:hypothetical protein
VYRQRIVRGCAGIMANLVLYLAAMLVMFLLLGRVAQLLTSWT